MGELLNVINSFDELIESNSELIESIGDCPNIERPVKRSFLWKRVATKGRYECQENVISGKCRIVSHKGIRVANGSKSVMIEKMKRLGSEEFLKPGDVIGVSRNGIYEHYAVYVGDGRVIHYAGEGDDFNGIVSVHEAGLSEFMKESDDYFVVWFDDGIPHKIRVKTSFLFTGPLDYYNRKFQKKKRNTFSAKDTIERARSRIGETEYSLVNNNCEHFAMWCKTGVSESSQVKVLESLTYLNKMQ